MNIMAKFDYTSFGSYAQNNKKFNTYKYRTLKVIIPTYRFTERRWPTLHPILKYMKTEHKI